MTTYAEHMSAIADAAQKMYAAHAAIPERPDEYAPDAVWDEYLTARQNYSAAQEVYNAAYAAKMGGYAATVRQA